MKTHEHAAQLAQTLRNMNHMGGDERGGYCICPLQDGSAPDHKHASICQDARAALAAWDKHNAKKETENV